jgi:hypothetical protein
VGDLVWLTDVKLKNEVAKPALKAKRSGPFIGSQDNPECSNSNDSTDSFQTTARNVNTVS